jgi:hypothetical protein
MIRGATNRATSTSWSDVISGERSVNEMVVVINATLSATKNITTVSRWSILGASPAKLFPRNQSLPTLRCSRYQRHFLAHD